MSFLTNVQRAEIQAMIARYEAGIAAGKTVSDDRVNACYRAAQHLVGCDDNDSPNAAFHGWTSKQLVEAFAARGAQ